MRRTTVIRLANAAPGNAAAGSALLPLLKDSSSEVRCVTAWALSQVREPQGETVSALLSSLRDDDVWARKAAADALQNFPLEATRIIPAFLDALTDSDSHVRAAICFGLGRLGGRQDVTLLARIVPALVGKLEDKDTEVRCNAAWALGTLQTNSAEAISALTKALTDPEEMVRKSATVALKSIREAAP
jgi:HEAT repeat protein